MNQQMKPPRVAFMILAIAVLCMGGSFTCKGNNGSTTINVK